MRKFFNIATKKYRGRQNESHSIVATLVERCWQHCRRREHRFNRVSQIAENHAK